jgi:putative transposase
MCYGFGTSLGRFSDLLNGFLATDTRTVCDRVETFYYKMRFRNLLAHNWGMARQALHIEVTSKDRETLRQLLRGGLQQVRVILRALALSKLAQGLSAPRISSVIPLTPQAIRKVGHRYQEGGLERALYEKERPGAAEVLNDSQKRRIITLVRNDPPEGRARWTVRLVVEQALKRKLVPRVGRETIRVLLLHHDLKPWRKKRGVRGRTG